MSLVQVLNPLVNYKLIDQPPWDAVSCDGDASILQNLFSYASDRTVLSTLPDLGKSGPKVWICHSLCAENGDQAAKHFRDVYKLTRPIAAVGLTEFIALPPDNILQLVKTRMCNLVIDASHEALEPSEACKYIRQSCDKYKLPLTQVLFVTGTIGLPAECNGIALMSWNGIFARPHYALYGATVQFVERFRYHREAMLQEKAWKNRFLVMCLDGKKPERVYLLLKMHMAGLLEQSRWSLGVSAEVAARALDHPFVRNVMRMEELPNLRQGLSQLAGGLPKLLTTDPDMDLYPRFGIMQLNPSFFKDVGMSVILETNNGRCSNIHVTEKTAIPLLLGVPFIVLANAGTLQAVRDWGFRTYHPWIREDYDKEPNFDRRMQMCIAEMTRLANLDDTAFQEVLQNLLCICTYNQGVFLGARESPLFRCNQERLLQILRHNTV